MARSRVEWTQYNVEEVAKVDVMVKSLMEYMMIFVGPIDVRLSQYGKREVGMEGLNNWLACDLCHICFSSIVLVKMVRRAKCLGNCF